MPELKAANPSRSRERIWDFSVLLLSVIGLLPMLYLQFTLLWSKPDTMLVPLCWVALGILTFYEPKGVATARWRVLLSYVFLASAFATGIAAVVFFSSWLATLSLALAYIGWGLIRLVASTFTRILALSSLILVTLTLPFGLDLLATTRSNSLVVRCCGAVLDLFNVFHLYQSPYLALKERFFAIAELMSNVFSIQTMVAVALVASVSWHRSFVATLFSVGNAVIWTILGKIFYLFIIAVGGFNGLDLTESFWGALILVGLFLFFLILTLISDGFWGAVFAPIRMGDEAVNQSATADLFNRLAIWPAKYIKDERTVRARTAHPERALGVQPMMGILFGFLMLILIVPTSLAVLKNDLLFNRSNYLAISSDRLPDAKSLPDNFFNKQRQRQFRSLTGTGIDGGSANTLFWNYGGSGVDTSIFLHYPVRGWMPESATLFQGWKKSESGMKSDSSNWPWSESLYLGETGGGGLFLSSQLHTKGEPYVPTEDELLAARDEKAKAVSLFSFRIFEMLNPKQQTLRPQTYCIQLRYQSETLIREEEKQAIVAKFLEAREILAGRLLGKPPVANP